MKRIPLRDATSGDTYLLEGERQELVPRSNTVYIDRDGQTFDPAQRPVKFDELSGDGVMELPRTTWFGGVSWIA